MARVEKAATGPATTHRAPAKTTVGARSATPGRAAAAGRAKPSPPAAKTTKAPAKPAAKAPAKPSGKTPAAKSGPAPAKAKPAAKASAKPAAKTPAARSGPAPAKPKPAAKAPAAKAPAARSGAAPAKPATKTPAKPAAAKAEPKAAPKPAPKPAPARRSGPLDKFLLEQRQLLLDERATHVHQAELLKDEADALAAEMEPGESEFGEEGGEGGNLSIERELDLVLSAQAKAAVDEIDRALAKIAAGTYGLCEKCGREIPRARLKALPHAPLCVAFKSGGLSRR